ncbi:hypothetical protein [Alkalibacillus haloalkaliphilus]|uniref:hypothetical protein n=1 Tax=Alkalibacillus haloalkaliphilus TaxID=94136 RepID=UPI00293570C8|nr:hypothetical protein [Alkalibacillus haloalkaliphilus]MDV2581978.1 hypothetical protein [Alkalibacillus haloalkaliphilus]
MSNLLMIFLPFIIIGVCIIVVMYISKGVSSILPDRIVKNQSRIVIGGYSTVLLISGVVYFTVVNEEHEVVNYTEHMDVASDIRLSLMEGTFEDFDRLSVRESWSFEVEDELTVTWAEQHGRQNLPVYVKENKSLNGTMDVRIYTPEYLLIGDVVISNQHPIPSISNRSGTLQIESPNRINLEKSLITHEQTLKRFLRDAGRGNTSYNHNSVSTLVIELPPGVEVNSEVNQLFDQRES